MGNKMPWVYKSWPGEMKKKKSIGTGTDERDQDLYALLIGMVLHFNVFAI